MLGATHAWPFISGSLEQTYGSRFIMTTRFALDVQVLTVLQVSIQVVAELSLEVRHPSSGSAHIWISINLSGPSRLDVCGS